jgi:hypothetical protein
VQSRRIFFWGLIVAAGMLAGAPARGQYNGQTSPAPGITPVAPPPYGQGFDPYSNQSGGGGAPPALLGPPASAIPGATDPFCGPSYGPAYPSVQPPTLFPGAPSFASPVVTDPPLKLFQNIRAEGTYIYDEGDYPESLEIVEWEVATTLAYPNFAYSGQPLLVSPGFAMTFFDGPETIPVGDLLPLPAPPPPPAAFPADLPPRVYGAWVDVGWFPNSRFAQQVSYELTGRIGVYSDFEEFNEDSIRTMGTALIKLRITPTLTAKAGVEYIDRADIKLLPAGGFLWTPNAHTRWDIYFPRPKLANYFTTLGNTEIWWYVGGEYGGDSWTIERTDFFTPLPPGAPRPTFADRMDYNDIRATVGLEWFNPYGLKGFVEGGWVFEREVVYVRRPQDSFSPDDTFMVRAGVAY